MRGEMIAFSGYITGEGCLENTAAEEHREPVSADGGNVRVTQSNRNTDLTKRNEL